MSSTAVSTAQIPSAAKPKTEKEQREIINTFQKLREEQKMIASKAAELQIEQKSHE